MNDDWMSLPKTKSLEAYPLISDWLDFSEPGVVKARSGRVEIGQGIAIALRRIVAEALSLEMVRVHLVAGDTRESPNENYTAGSMSVELGGQSLRAAALAARATFLLAARDKLDAETVDLQDGQVLQHGEETELDIWKLASDLALDIPIAEAVVSRPGRMARIDETMAEAGGDAIRARLRGGAFIHDIVLENMLHARVLHLPHPAAQLVFVDSEAVEALPGVVMLHRDGAFAAVIAEEEAQAMSAVARADSTADWDVPGGGIQKPEDLLASATELETMAEAGDLARAGNRKVVAEFSRPFLAHASIGTCCALALWQDGTLTVWSHAQGPYQLRAGLAQALNLDEAAIDVIHKPAAGCYGHNGADDVAFEVALLARACPGRPVRLAWRRVDELTRGSLAPAMTSRAEITLSDGGEIAAMSLDIVSAPHQRRPGPGKPSFASGPLLADPVALAPATEPPPANGGGADRNAVPLYKTGALKVARRVAYDIPLRTSAMRALGAYANIAAIELAMEAAADELGEDPIGFRLRHLDDPRARRVVEKARDMSGFTTDTDGETAKGLGFARYKNKAGYCAVVVEVSAGESLIVPRLWAAADVGEVIDREGVLGQVEGGAIQSLSWSLKEEVPIIGGAPDVPDWEHYPILRFSEIPVIEVALTGDPRDPPLGAGEIAQGPVAGALAAAVRRLFGLDSLRVPLTPEGLAGQMLG
ncbi:molybdopterin cofactor-binding domain-containing protein [Nitratireductor luteus]|uniref:molybdopterin cofactor-binding domain-containing protein n=1 Tax=Nitratireductor luteus TaxID=2976980 RepID=UPI002240CC3E|nr:molybdopterin cofactor-binding domain-containing protein [Nitratireductor luteus]